MSVTDQLYKLIDEQMKRLERRDKRQADKDEVILQAYLDKESAQKSAKDEEELRRVRRRLGGDRAFRGCTEEEAEEDLLEIFEGEKADKYVHVLPDGQAMVVLKKIKIVEGDVIRIEKGEAYEVGVVRSLHKGVLVLESREREKKYSLSKLLSSRYVIVKQNPGKTKQH
ncbi:hypothetical protein NEHOM01_1968 [Nematocida homosporus]|uniref:uncharacterized protein n=1 Tax=Nematocida homosporus TaxID=1912981 RepID=UPI0022210CEC|nr:uncharacterized protein NEHOM01_1968 [Nematocida homosporus]KAI5187152.1 hypothetical protein NEHOM01_1968 [Nematocida homosporus]